MGAECLPPSVSATADVQVIMCQALTLGSKTTFVVVTTTMDSDAILKQAAELTLKCKNNVAIESQQLVLAMKVLSLEELQEEEVKPLLDG